MAQTFTGRQVARALGVDEKTVRIWISKGWLTASRPSPKRYRIKWSSLRKALKHPGIAELVQRSVFSAREVSGE